MPDEAIANLIHRVTILEAQADAANEIPGQLAGLTAKVRTLKAAVGGLNNSLEAKVDETALRSLSDGLETTLRDSKDGLESKVGALETKVDGLSNRVVALPKGKGEEELTKKVSRIEGQISMAMWLGPLVVAVIALVIQFVTP